MCPTCGMSDAAIFELLGLKMLRITTRNFRYCESAFKISSLSRGGKSTELHGCSPGMPIFFVAAKVSFLRAFVINGHNCIPAVLFGSTPQLFYYFFLFQHFSTSTYQFLRFPFIREGSLAFFGSSQTLNFT